MSGGRIGLVWRLQLGVRVDLKKREREREMEVCWRRDGEEKGKREGTWILFRQSKGLGEW